MRVLIKNMEIPEHCGYCRFRYDGICHALQKTQYSVEECPLVSVNDIKTAQLEQKKGKWIETDDGWDGIYYVCSECGSECGCPWTLIDGTPYDNGMHYCPNCGAEMVKGEEECYK